MKPVRSGALAALALLLLLVPSLAPPTRAATRSSPAAALFAKAESDFAALRGDPARQRLRQSYARVLERYRRVFEDHPKTRQAEQSLLRAGALYALLYTWTRQEGDLNRAQNYYERLLASYPRSQFAADAQLAVGYLHLDHYKDPGTAWLKFREVARLAPGGEKAAEAARLLKRLAKHAPPEPKPQPADAELDFPCPTPSRNAERAPAPPPQASPAAKTSAGAAPAALARIRGIRSWSNPAYSRVVVDLDQKAHFFSNLLEDRGDGKPPRLYIDFFGTLAEERLCQPLQVNDGIVRTIRAAQFTPDSVRIVLDLDRLGTYRIFPMENPFRLVIDATGGGAQPPSPAPSQPSAYAGSAGPPPAEQPPTAPPAGTVEPLSVPRLAPLPTAVAQQASSSPAPEGEPPAAPQASTRTRKGKREAFPPPPPPPSAPARTAGGKLSLAQQLGLGVRRVVIDAGHGAHDPGAIGVGGLQEKDVTLDLALRVRDLLRRDGLETVLTRDRDVFIPLEERTAIANTASGDLFLSIHCNASDRGNLSGIETYYLNLASSRRAMQTAARENSMALARMSDLDAILKQIFNSKMDESSRLADLMQRSLSGAVRRRFRDTKDLGVKQAPFYVLIGAEMPSILAEVSFINHRVEGRRLADPGYRQLLAQALSEGVVRYIRTVKLAALPPSGTAN